MTTHAHVLSPLRLALWLLLLTAFSAAGEPIRLHPENGHYFEWRGRPVILITSAEHYGAVLNLDFDYQTYLRTLSEDGMNYTRVFTGAYVEPDGAFNIARNTLAPLPGRFICPWARGPEPGYGNGGNKFDLTKWDEAYFARLSDFIRTADAAGVAVEVTLFCPMYEDKQWSLSPMNARNNVNGLGAVPRTDVYTLDKNDGLMEAQERLTRKIVTELNAFDNVFFEICNEPYFGGVTMDWQHRIADIIVETERALPKKHLIAQNIANNKQLVEDPHPAVSVFNFHYATPPDTVSMNHALDKVIGDDETGFRGTGDAAYRTEAWDFILAGGGLYNNLDYSFTAGHEAGTFAYPPTQPGGGGQTLRQQLRVLSQWIHEFDFIRMAPQNSVIRGGLPPGATARALVDPDRAMAIYVRSQGSTGSWSARWTGFIEAPATGETHFHTFSNDGIRLWIGGEKIVEDWTDHGEKEDTGRISLTKGARYPVKLEYFYNGGQGVTKLWWTPPGGRREPVPANAFRLPENSGDGDGWGLRGEYFKGTDLQSPMGSRDDGQIDFNWGVNPPLAEGNLEDAAGLALEVDLPPGSWTAEWLDTKSGETSARVKVTGGTVRKLQVPRFEEDIALRVVRAPAAGPPRP